jgi:hypothetical protein
MARPRVSEEQKRINKEKYMKTYYLENKEKVKETSKRFKDNNPGYFEYWHQCNIEKVKEYHQQYHQDNKEKANTASKQWVSNNKARCNKSTKQRKQADPLFKLKSNIRTLILIAFNNKNHRKKSKTVDILGCSFEEFKQHLESQFEPWMTWDNRGGKEVLGPNMTWDLDHIIPVSSAITEEELIKLNHYTNFQPLCSYQNRFVKKDKI